jgi:hypothetical protein
MPNHLDPAAFLESKYGLRSETARFSAAGTRWPVGYVERNGQRKLVRLPFDAASRFSADTVEAPARFDNKARPDAHQAGDFVGATKPFPDRHGSFSHRPVPRFFISDDHLKNLAYVKSTRPGFISLKPDSPLARFHNTIGDHNYVAFADPKTGNVHQLAEVKLRDAFDKGSGHMLELIGDPHQDRDESEINPEMRDLHAKRLFDAYRAELASRYNPNPTPLPPATKPSEPAKTGGYYRGGRLHLSFPPLDLNERELTPEEQIGRDLARRDFHDRAISKALPIAGDSMFQHYIESRRRSWLRRHEGTPNKKPARQKAARFSAIEAEHPLISSWEPARQTRLVELARRIIGQLRVASGR